MSITLIGIDGPRSGERIAVDDTSLDLAATLDGEPLVRLTPDGDGLLLRELGGDGVWLNGHRVIEAPVHDGDQLQVGASRFRIEGGGPTAWRCPGCGLGLAAVPDERCPRCGRDSRALGALPDSPAGRFCVACGKAVPAEAKFCPACGRDQEPAPAAAPAPAGGVPRWVAPTLAAIVVLLLLVILVVVGSLAMIARRVNNAIATLPIPNLDTPPAVVTEAPPAEAAAPVVESVELPAEGKVKLRYGGQAGDSFRYRATGSVDGSLSVMGQSMPLQVATTTGYTQDILSADDGQLTFRLTQDPIGAQQNGQPFGGALPATPAPVTVTMDRRGRMQRVDQPGGGEQLPIPGLPGGVALDQRAIVEQLSAAALPAEAVGVGDTWSHQVDVPMGENGSMKITTQCRLDGFERRNGVRVARVVSQMTAPVEMNLTDPKDQAGIEHLGSISGSVTTWFDPERGVMVASDSNLTMDFTMKLADTPSGGGAEREGVPGLDQLLGGQGNLELKASGTIRQKVELDDAGRPVR